MKENAVSEPKGAPRALAELCDRRLDLILVLRERALHRLLVAGASRSQPPPLARAADPFALALEDEQPGFATQVRKSSSPSRARSCSTMSRPW
jgi:hypothetical protein